MATVNVRFQHFAHVQWAPIKAEEGANRVSQAAFKVAAFVQSYLQSFVNLMIDGLNKFVDGLNNLHGRIYGRESQFVLVGGPKDEELPPLASTETRFVMVDPAASQATAVLQPAFDTLADEVARNTVSLMQQAAPEAPAIVEAETVQENTFVPMEEVDDRFWFQRWMFPLNA